MKMKTTALFVTALILFQVRGFAQTTATVTLNVVLTNQASIVIAAGAQTATLTYSTPANYTNGVTLSQTAAMTTVSNQAYSVTVLSGSDLLNGSNTIPVADVTVTPSFTGTNTNITLTPQAIPKTTAAKIIASTVGTASQVYNLQYSTVGAPTSDFLGLPAGTYTSTLTYTITNP